MMVAEGLTIGGWFASSIISNVISSLVSYVQDLKKQLGLKEELSRLEKTLPKIQALLDAVDRGQIKEETRALEKWLWQFRDAVDEADDFMDAMEYHRQEEIHGEKSTVSPAASCFKRLKIKIKSAKSMFKRGGVHQDSTLKRLKEIVNRLDEIAAEVGVFLEIVKTSAQPPVATSTRETGSRLTVETRVFGRDKEKEMVINKLLNFNPASKKNYSILPIVGIGGIGKTTLAQFVFHDERIREHFRKRMWVCVSNNPDLILLTQKIYQSIIGEKSNLDNLDSLQEKISEKLKSERFLLVLDDVWDDVYKIGLEKLLAPLRSGERGSMILLTTRITGIGGTMMGKLEPLYLNGLDEGYYWEFFKECAFLDEDPECHKRLQDIGRRIAQKLHGSPLAAKTVGGILSTNLDDNYWKTILHSEIWELKQGENDIMPALRLSYQYSPSHLKPCFTFCSIFPPDYEFRKEELVYMWMALGLLQEPINGNRRPEDIGDEYLKDLVRRSFFDSRGCFYVMHDLLHELAVFVSRGECLRIEERSEPIPIPTSVRHLSITTSFALPSMPEITKLKHLRTLLLLKLPDCDVPKMLKALTSLRILESSTVEITDECISSLKHLRYLSNDGIIRPVPESVNKLYHLQFLYYKIGNPDHFPTLYPSYCINNLINLRHLSTPESRGGKFSAGIGRLSLLQNLEFNVNENGNNLFELKNLRELRELGIDDLQKARDGQLVSEAKLNDKRHLQILNLRWSGKQRSNGSPEGEVDEQVLDALQPHPNLKELTIKNYMGRRSPHWMTPMSPSELVYLCLSGCKGWEDVTPLGQLPYLKSLHLISMHSVKRIDRGTEHVGLFPSLQVLRICNMMALEELCGTAAGTTQWLPCLRNLWIQGCPKLRLCPNLPCGLDFLHLASLEWAALPELWQGENINSLSVSSASLSLSNLTIFDCGRLVSLAEGLLVHSRPCKSLQELSIFDCAKLTHLPVGGFEEFTSLKELRIEGCPELRRGSASERFLLPPSLQLLSVYNCDALDPLPSASEDLPFLHSVALQRCAIESLPSAEVLGRWTALNELSLEKCSELESLGGLQVLSSLKSLKVVECPKLVAAASSSPSALVVENPTSSSSSSCLILDKFDIDDPLMLRTLPLRSISALDVKIQFCDEARSSALEEWVLKNRTSLQKLSISNVSSRQFPVVNLQSLSSLEFLDIKECNNLQSLPELPSSLEAVCLDDCSSELEERCLRDSGPDWPKIQRIPEVKIGKYSKEQLAATTPAEHRRPQLV